MERVSKNEYFMAIARVVATRSTCLRRAVGCVLVSELGHILATGYNGVAEGMDHCNEVTETFLDGTPKIFGHACPGHDAPSGQNLDGCNAIHAEQNALLQCGDVRKIHACYVTSSPCVSCTKLLMNTSCKGVVFDKAYPHDNARSLWVANPYRIWIHHT